MRNLGRLHRPQFYRYEVAKPRLLWLSRNLYPGSWIGGGIVVGRYVYCVKWGRPL